MEQLYKKYRPKTLDEVIGQDAAVKKIQHALSRGWERAWWIAGPSGAGKTTLARIIAANGIWTTRYDSANEVTPEIIKGLRRRPVIPVVTIINEAHGLDKKQIRSFLGILETVTTNHAFIFTTTKTGQEKLLDDHMDARPLLSRCVNIQLTNQGLAPLFAQHCHDIAVKEGLERGQPVKAYEQLARECKNNCRAMLMEIEAGCMLK